MNKTSDFFRSLLTNIQDNVFRKAQIKTIQADTIYMHNVKGITTGLEANIDCALCYKLQNGELVGIPSNARYSNNDIKQLLDKEGITKSEDFIFGGVISGTNIIVKNDGTAKIQNTKSSITIQPGGEIIIESNSTVTIESGASVDLNCVTANVNASGAVNIVGSEVKIGSGATALALNANAVIIAPPGGGPCTISNPGTTITKVK